MPSRKERTRPPPTTTGEASSRASLARGVGKTGSHFGYSGPLTEAVLLGSIAIRVPETTLRWDTATLKFTNSETATALVTKKYRKGWEVKWVE